MDIFSLRNKLKATTARTNSGLPPAATNSGALEPVVVAPVTLELMPEPKCQPEINLPEHIGLDSLFEMTNTELHALSPNNSFSRLRVTRKGQTIEQVEIAEPVTVSVHGLGLNALLTMDGEEVDKLVEGS